MHKDNDWGIPDIPPSNIDWALVIGVSFLLGFGVAVLTAIKFAC